jgi:hypothetical protein
MLLSIDNHRSQVIQELLLVTLRESFMMRLMPIDTNKLRHARQPTFSSSHTTAFPNRPVWAAAKSFEQRIGRERYVSYVLHLLEQTFWIEKESNVEKRLLKSTVVLLYLAGL